MVAAMREHLANQRKNHDHCISSSHLCLHFRLLFRHCLPYASARTWQNADSVKAIILVGCWGGGTQSRRDQPIRGCDPTAFAVLAKLEPFHHTVCGFMMLC